MSKIITQYCLEEYSKVKKGILPKNATLTTDIKELQWLFPAETEPEHRITLIGCSKKVLDEEVIGMTTVKPFCELRDLADNPTLDPDLIQVGYDHNRTTKEDVRAMLGGAERIKILPYECMKPIQSEHIETEPILDSYMQLVEFLKENEHSSKHCIRHGIRQRAPDIIDPLEILKDTYGLTSVENLILIGTRLTQAFSEYERI